MVVPVPGGVAGSVCPPHLLPLDLLERMASHWVVGVDSHLHPEEREIGREGE